MARQDHDEKAFPLLERGPGAEATVLAARPAPATGARTGSAPPPIHWHLLLAAVAGQWRQSGAHSNYLLSIVRVALGKNDLLTVTSDNYTILVGTSKTSLRTTPKLRGFGCADFQKNIPKQIRSEFVL